MGLSEADIETKLIEPRLRAKRVEKAVRITYVRLQIWQLNAEKEMALKWSM